MDYRHILRITIFTIGLTLGSSIGVPSAATPETQEDNPEQAPAKVPVTIAPKVEVSIDQLIDSGLSAFFSNNYASAANYFWYVYKKAETGSEERETAQYYLARSLKPLKLTYAASEFFYEIIKSGSNIDRIVDSLYSLQTLMETAPYDEDLIKNDLVFNTEYEFLPGDLLDFVNYYKGEVNFRKKNYRWANMRFALISEKSYYFNKVKFLKGIQILALGKVDEAMKIFDEIISDQFQDFNIKNKARETIARLLYEQGKYKEAYETAVAIDSSPLTQDSIFLLKAWSLYFMKRYQETLGALNSLWSPLSKERFFYPEKYILKGLTLRAICQFTDAKANVVDFQNEYGNAIETILNRADPLTNKVLTNAAMWDEGIASKTAFITLLGEERERALAYGSGWDDSGLKKFLREIYDLKIDEIRKLVDNDTLDRFKKVSNELLDYYEQVKLLEYELSLDELSRLKKPPLDAEPVEKIPIIYRDRVFWPFDGEYWTDELLTYRNLIPNQCGGGGS